MAGPSNVAVTCALSFAPLWHRAEAALEGDVCQLAGRAGTEAAGFARCRFDLREEEKLGQGRHLRL